MALITLGRIIANLRNGNEIWTDKANVVTTNAATDIDFTETIGRKGDTAVGDPRATASIAALLRGLVLGQGGYVAVVDSNVATTTFGDASFASFANDHFNNNFVGICFSGASITEGTIKVITDFTSAAGVFTSSTWGATTTVGDIFIIYPRNLICEGSSLPVRIGDIDTAAATGAVSSAEDLMAYLKQAITLLLGTMPGQEFTIIKRLAKTAVLTASAVDLTGVSSGGTLTLKRVAIMNDTNASGGASTGVFIQTNDANEPLKVPILGTGGGLAASVFADINIGYQVQTGKKVQVQAGTSNLSGTGNLTFHLTFIRGAEGATIAAA